MHVPLILWAASVPFVSYPCPFTDWEKSLRTEAALALSQSRELSKLACARARIRFAEGDNQAAIEDILATLFMARIKPI